MSKYFLLGATALSALWSLPAYSQSNDRALDEIIVTAQHRESGLQDVPISMSAVDANMIANTSIVRLDDLTVLVPNFTYTESGISTQFYIRGIGSGVNQGFEQSVGVYVDGVNFPRGQQARAPFLDLERVEVLRGPQSILFGKNSVAGALSITTAKPTREFEGSLFGSYEFEDGENIVEGMLSGPLSDRIRLRAAARYRETDGFITNATLNQIEPIRDELTIRGTAEIDVTENLLARFKIENSNFDMIGRNTEVDPAEIVTAGPFAGLDYGQILVNVFGQDPSVLNQVQDGIRSSNGELSENQMTVYQMTLDWDLGGFNVQAISAYETLDYTELCDCDFNGANIFTLDIEETYKQFSQEIRLTSPLGKNLDYILGAYFQTSDHFYTDEINVESNSILIPAFGAAGALLSGTQSTRRANVDTTVLSAFAQANWHFTDSLTLQLGGRITNEDKTGTRRADIEALGGGALPAAQAGAALVFAGGFLIASSNLDALSAANVAGAAALVAQLGAGVIDPVNRNVTKFSPDVKLVWDVNDDAMLYASWARGFKSGGFDFRANNRGRSPTAREAFEFDDEIATNYEIGGKFSFGGVAELNATAYFTKYDDLQVSIFDSGVGFNVGNAAQSEIKGIELDGRWAVHNNIRLAGGLSLIDFEYTDFRNGQCFVGRTPDVDIDGDGTNESCDFTGETGVLVSDVSGNIGVDFDFPVMGNYEITGLANLFYASAYNAAETYDPVGEQDAHTILTARIGFSPQDGPWEIALLGKNLTDQKIRTFAAENPLASTFGARSNLSFFSQGRTITVQARVKF